MSLGDQKFRIWDAYWHDNRIHSLGADSEPEITETLDQCWAGILRRLPPEASVLDIACGNGAVGLSLTLAAEDLGRTVAITGIDEADIDPARYVREHADTLGGMTFRPQILMEALPFADGTFDAVVSQFGFEYGNVPQAMSEAARVLKPKGLLTILVLPANSHAALTAKKTVKQARYLLRDSSLFGDAFEIIRFFHEGPRAAREQKMRADLEFFNAEVEKTVRAFEVDETDVVFSIIMGLNKVFIDRRTTTMDEQVASIENLRTGLAQYAARAQATTKAALTEGGLTTLKRTIGTAGFTLRDTRSILVDNHGTVAWQLTADH